MDASSFPAMPLQPAHVDSGGGESMQDAVQMPLVSHAAASAPDAPGGDLPLAAWQTLPVFAGVGDAAFLNPYALQGMEAYPQACVPPWVLVQPQNEMSQDEVFHSADGSSFEPTPYGTSYATSPPESPPAFDVLPFSAAHPHPSHDTAVIRSDDMSGFFDHGSVLPTHDPEFPPNDTFAPVYNADFFVPMSRPRLFDIAPVYPNAVEPVLEPAQVISTERAAEPAEIARIATPSSTSPPVIDLTFDSPLGEHRMLDGDVILPAVDPRLPQPLGSRRMPPRELELRVMSEAEIARISPGERRKIYVSSMERHVDALYGAALAISRYDCNRDRIAQLVDVDTRTVKTTTTQMQEELSRLRDRRDALRARNVALRAGSALRPPSPQWP